MKPKLIFTSVILAAILLLATSFAHAIPYGFYNITNNNSNNADIGEDQLLMDVTDPGDIIVSGNTVHRTQFKFSNIGANDSSITKIYFDDGVLLGISDIESSSGVSFSRGVTPDNLPGGDSLNPPFETTQPELLFAASSDILPGGVVSNGVNPGEYVSIVFALKQGYGFDDVISNLNLTAIRVGIFVQGFDGGGSESFINNPYPIPEPATVLLIGTGLSGLAGFRKRTKRT